MTELNANSLANLKPFQPGNPGRPKGSRNKLAEAFIADLVADWEQHGSEAIVQVREERPHEYLKVVASILPKEIKIDRNDDMTDDQLRQRIRLLAEELGFALGVIEGTCEVIGDGEATERSH